MHFKKHIFTLHEVFFYKHISVIIIPALVMFVFLKESSGDYERIRGSLEQRVTEKTRIPIMLCWN